MLLLFAQHGVRIDLSIAARTHPYGQSGEVTPEFHGLAQAARLSVRLPETPPEVVSLLEKLSSLCSAGRKASLYFDQTDGGRCASHRLTTALLLSINSGEGGTQFGNAGLVASDLFLCSSGLVLRSNHLHFPFLLRALLLAPS